LPGSFKQQVIFELLSRDDLPQLEYKSLITLIAAGKPVLVDKILPIALRPRDSSNSISSRYASLAPDGRLPPCSGNRTSGKKPVITSLAGFELAERMVTDVAAFAGALRPEPPGARKAIPADLK
jgi:hypothetical protein